MYCFKSCVIHPLVIYIYISNIYFILFGFQLSLVWENPYVSKFLLFFLPDEGVKRWAMYCLAHCTIGLPIFVYLLLILYYYYYCYYFYYYYYYYYYHCYYYYYYYYYYFVIIIIVIIDYYMTTTTTTTTIII